MADFALGAGLPSDRSRLGEFNAHQGGLGGLETAQLLTGFDSLAALDLPGHH
jgi:hypothetical protein